MDYGVRYFDMVKKVIDVYIFICNVFMEYEKRLVYYINCKIWKYDWKYFLEMRVEIY